MKTLGLVRAACIVGLLAAATLPALAHHSFAAEFDRAKPVKLKGVITRLEWQNPHIWLFVDVTGDDGKVTNWGFSGGPPGLLTRRGVNKETLKVGTVVIVSGFRAKDGFQQRVRRKRDVRRRPERVHRLGRRRCSE